MAREDACLVNADRGNGSSKGMKKRSLKSARTVYYGTSTSEVIGR